MLRFFTTQRQPILLAGVALVPVAILASLFHSYAMNVPLWDDHALKAFILTWEKNGVWSGLKALFSQHNEHRIAFTRLVTLLIYSVQGTIQYDTMMMVGNLGLLGTFLFWASGWKNNPDRWIWWATGSWLVFTLALYENFYWGMASLQNFGILFFAIATFFFHSQKPKSKLPYQDIRFLLGLHSGFFALFTSGNGLIVPLISVLLLATQKRWKSIGYAAGFWGVCLLLHLLTFTNRTDLSVQSTSFTFTEVFRRFLMLSGAVTDSFSIWESGRDSLAILWGGLCVAVVVFFLVRLPFQMFFKKYLPITWYQLLLASFSLFVLGTILGTVIARMPYPTSILFTSKYKIYSNLLTLLAFSFAYMLVPTPWKRTWAWVGFGISIVFYLNSYLLDYRFHLYTFQDRTADLANLYFADRSGKIPMNQHPYKHPESILADSFLPKEALQAPRWVDSVAMQPTEVAYFEFGEDADFRSAYLIIKGDSLTHVQPLYQSVQPFFLKRVFRPWGHSLMGRVSRMNLPSGLYDTFVWLDQPPGGKWLNVQKTIRIKGYTQPEKPKNW